METARIVRPQHTVQRAERQFWRVKGDWSYAELYETGGLADWAGEDTPF